MLPSMILLISKIVLLWTGWNVWRWLGFPEIVIEGAEIL
jgi:hypothetical protein